jgi:hypothetical protein
MTQCPVCGLSLANQSPSSPMRFRPGRLFPHLSNGMQARTGSSPRARRQAARLKMLKRQVACADQFGTIPAACTASAACITSWRKNAAVAAVSRSSGM